MNMQQNQTFSGDLPRYIVIILLLSLTLLLKAGVPGVYGQSTENQSLSSIKLGRKNPFMPLVFVNSVKSNQRKSSSATREVMQPEIDAVSSDEEPVIRLMAILISSGAQGEKPMAIIEENSIGKSVSVGDTVAGMEVVEIRLDQVSLNKGDEFRSLTLGVATEGR